MKSSGGEQELRQRRRELRSPLEGLSCRRAARAGEGHRAASEPALQALELGRRGRRPGRGAARAGGWRACGGGRAVRWRCPVCGACARGGPGRPIYWVGAGASRKPSGSGSGGEEVRERRAGWEGKKPLTPLPPHPRGDPSRGRELGGAGKAGRAEKQASGDAGFPRSASLSGPLAGGPGRW